MRADPSGLRDHDCDEAVNRSGEALGLSRSDVVKDDVGVENAQ